MADQERLQILTRLGRETIIKRGTYDVSDVRKIDPDHIHGDEETGEKELQAENSGEDMSDEELAAAILQSNFRTGMSQSEVDKLLSGL